MEPFQQFLLLWLSQRDKRRGKPRHAEPDDESDRRAAYKGVTPGILCALETALAKWREMRDLDGYETRVRQAIASLPHHERAVRRLIEPLRWRQSYRVESELQWLHRMLEGAGATEGNSNS